VVRSRSGKRLQRHAAALIGALAAAAITGAPARAGFLDFLFGGLRPTPPSDANSYAEPAAPSQESLPSSGGIGHAVAFCVRLCDGRHFPLEHLSNAAPAETCRAMCPASRTKVFFGGEIDHAVARDGARYADLDNAFVYRSRLVASCTCNGKDAFGLARFDLSADPTLRPGDIVATDTGFKAFAGKRSQADTFTPVDPAAIAGELNGGSSVRLRLTQGKEPQAVATPLADVQAVR